MKRIIRREKYLEALHSGRDVTGLVKVITGMRRCGKSTLLEQYMQDLRDSGVDRENIVLMNLESFEYQGIRDSEALNEAVLERIRGDERMYLLFDEIQNVEGWERTVSALGLMRNCDIYITGSNSRMLSSELATHISGRYVEIRMLPLSFKEYMELHPHADIELRFREYLRFGALPEVDPARGEEFCDGHLDGVFNTVLVKDILQRIKTDDVSKILAIARFLYSNIGNLTNISGIAKAAGLSSVTVERYVSEMEDALLFYHADRYDIAGKRLLSTNGKYYASDLGLRNSALKGARGADISRPLENVVFLELLRRGYDVVVGSFRDREVDFAARKGDRVEYYQVTATMLSEETRRREFGSLESIRDNHRKTILTADRLGLGSEGGIDVANIYDWLLQDPEEWGTVPQRRYGI